MAFRRADHEPPDASQKAGSRDVNDPLRTGPGRQPAQTPGSLTSRLLSCPGCPGRHKTPPVTTSAPTRCAAQLQVGQQVRSAAPPAHQGSVPPLQHRAFPAERGKDSPPAFFPFFFPLLNTRHLAQAVPTKGRRCRYRWGRTTQSSWPVPRLIASAKTGDRAASSTGSPRSIQARNSARNRGALKACSA